MSKKALEYFNGDDLATGVWQGKYALEGEETPDDMHKRMAKHFARIEEKYRKGACQHDNLENLSEYGKMRGFLGEEKIYNFFKDFKYIIPQGSVMSQLGADSIGSLSNCFVIGQPEDSYGGIFLKEEEMVQLMKRRGGVGIDLSTLRPEGTSTTNAAKSSTGAVSFMHRYSHGTREVAQNGRRGALMLSMDIKHPDIMNFVTIKRDLTQVTGANISIKLWDDFMRAVEKDEDYVLRFPCSFEEDKFSFQKSTDIPMYNELFPLYNNLSGKKVEGYIKKIRAKQYWDEIIKSAHSVAEPGLMFWDNMVNYSPDGVYPQFKQVTTNPCSEIGMQPYDACRLIAVNLFSFVVFPFTDMAYFDFEKFYRVNYEALRLSDDLVDLELEHIERILEKIKSDPETYTVREREYDLWEKVRDTAAASRRTGLGFTALGDTIAALGNKYDDSMELIKNIMVAKLESELDCTIDMAITRGTFEGWNPILETNDFYHFIDKEFPEQASRMDAYGRRNVSWSCIAPTGSLSIIAKAIRNPNLSSGLEPVFMPFYMRRKKVNPNDTNSRVDFTDQNGDTWQEYPVVMGAFKDWYQLKAKESDLDIELLTKEQMDEVFKNSPWYGSTANDIDWIKRVEIQSVIQKYVTHSISSTINLPNDVSEETVSQIYLESWKKGLKGITVYRDGSRSGVLVSQKEDKSVTKFEYRDAPKRPKSLPCKVHRSTSKGEKWLVIVGLLDGNAYEVFCVKDDFNLPNHTLEGVLTKVKRGEYRLDLGTLGTIEEITSEMTEEQEVVTRLLSTSLRHGANIKFLVEQLSKTDGDLFSFSKSVARVLKKYIPEGAKSTMTCESCGSENVIFQEGCNSCLDCGSSACS